MLLEFVLSILDILEEVVLVLDLESLPVLPRASLATELTVVVSHHMFLDHLQTGGGRGQAAGRVGGAGEGGSQTMLQLLRQGLVHV